MGASPILTLEPLIEAVRGGVEGAGWELSGLQKTTSHQFEGRWEGDATRSAYLFFHPPAGPDWVSIDAYLDETSRGLSGNLALVADLRAMGHLEPAEELLAALAEMYRAHMPARFRRPVTLRFRMADTDEAVASSETEVRFKVRIPSGAVQEGEDAIRSLARDVVAAFDRLLEERSLGALAAGRETE